MILYSVSIMFRVLTKSMMIVWVVMIGIVCGSFSYSMVQTIRSKTGGVQEDPDKVNLTLYHWDNGGSTETDLVKEVVEEFMIKYPHISVSVEIISSYEQQFQRFMAADNVPDVFCVPDGNFGQWVQTGVMLNLQEYYDNTTVIDKENIAPSALQRYRWNGKTMGSGDLYCVPKDITPYVMYYNLDLFDEYNVPYPTDIEYWVNFCKSLSPTFYDDYYGAGSKVDEMILESRILDPYTAQIMWAHFGYLRDTVGTDKYGKLKLDEENHIYGVAKLYPEGLIWSNGADYLSEDRTEVLIDSPEFMAAYAFIQQSQMDLAVAPTSKDLSSTSEKTLFLNETAACYIEGRSVTTDLRNKADFKWDIAPIPAFPANQQCNGWSGSVGYGIYVNCEHPDEAYLLAEYFTSKEGQFIMAEAGFTAPLYNDQETIDRFIEMEEGKMPANTEEFIRAAQYQRPGLWQYLPSVRWKERLDVDSGAMFTDDPSQRATPEQFFYDEKEKILDIIKQDFPQLFE